MAPTSCLYGSSQRNGNLPGAVSAPPHCSGWHVRVSESVFSTPGDTDCVRETHGAKRLLSYRFMSHELYLPPQIQPQADAELALPKYHQLQQLRWVDLGWLPGPHPAVFSPSSSENHSSEDFKHLHILSCLQELSLSPGFARLPPAVAGGSFVPDPLGLGRFRLLGHLV